MKKNCGCGKDPCETYGIKEDAPTNSVAGGGVDIAPNAGPKFKEISVTDRRRRKDKPPVILKRFRKFIDKQ